MATRSAVSGCELRGDRGDPNPGVWKGAAPPLTGSRRKTTEHPLTSPEAVIRGPVAVPTPRDNPQDRSPQPPVHASTRVAPTMVVTQSQAGMQPTPGGRSSKETLCVVEGYGVPNELLLGGGHLPRGSLLQMKMRNLKVMYLLIPFKIAIINLVTC